MIYLRSALFNTFMMLSVPLWVAALFLVLPFGYRARLGIASSWARTNLWVLKHVCRLDYSVEWRGQLPEQPCVIYMKHESTWETLAQMAVFRVQQSWVLKREILRIPVFGWGMFFMRPIAIDRRGGRRAVEQLVSQGQEKFAEGNYVMIFPEGHRMKPGKTRRYGMGGALLAREAGVPIVPMVHNAGDFWARVQFGKRPGTIQVVVGDAIWPGERSPQALNAEVQLWMERELRRISPNRDYEYARAEDAVDAAQRHGRWKR
ncbi:lysophospholipid acyltransferase family protein [Natronospira bacteriovora]|uniref:Lysophospholipid acyltransferase family protein n=1 Tax=Natronospira bacteriovora TaxID=3069753 RepID=A0ABU0W711_9GAMM|nr:lysophospholipid acyltransferase family protein [Natronospira sp. AB-CW4]MDQ2069796.1 lysophospholipid acyltransferase family protein [Natronospira sp. AB-CW4]